jgi:D-threo-aldose 1-dehydrogenase
MKYRDFGTTGKKVSQLVFGGGAVGGLLINQDDETKLKAVQRAMQAGINWIDTAPSYGQGRSEAALGWILQELDERPYVATKFSIDLDDLSNIPGQIERSLETSLERLQSESVTLLQLHNQIGEQISERRLPVSYILGKDGVIDGLQRLKEQGLIEHFGITALGETSSILQVIESGRIDSAQVYYNMLNPSAGMHMPASWPVYDFSGILAACRAQGVAAMNIRVFSAGVIATDERTGREGPLTVGDTVESEAAKARAIFEQIGLQYGTRAQTAIRFALAEARMSCVIFGLAELDHLEQALAAEEMGPLPAEAIEHIRSIYQGY